MRLTPVLFAMAVAIAGCADHEAGLLEGRPGGPYRLTLRLDPPAPRHGEPADLQFQVTHARSGEPVTDLQLAHERLVHNFIVARDFSSFAHIHHEDFEPVSEGDRAAGRLRFPYRFPAAGSYRVVSEFAHRNRSWTKHFDIEVDGGDASRSLPADTSRRRTIGDYRATLRVSPEAPVAGYETELALQLERGGEPVTDLALHLGSELHGAVWREDGRNFGHLHSYTPRVAAILQLAHERSAAPEARGSRLAEMMVQLMCLDAELVFPGPVVPMRYVFPEPGRYHVFLEAAPAGEPRVFQFALDVVAWQEGADTTVRSVLDAAPPGAGP